MIKASPEVKHCECGPKTESETGAPTQLRFVHYVRVRLPCLPSTSKPWPWVAFLQHFLLSKQKNLQLGNSCCGLGFINLHRSPMAVRVYKVFFISGLLVRPVRRTCQPGCSRLNLEPQWELTRIQGGRSGSDRWKPRSRSEHAGSQKWYHFYRFT